MRARHGHTAGGPAGSTTTDGDAGRRRVRRLGDILLIAGGLLLAYPLWSAAYAQVQQSRLDAAYEASAAGFTPPATIPVPSARPLPESEVVRRAAVAYAKRLEKGDVVGRLKIARLSLNRVIQEGTDGDAALDPDSDRALLRNGPVHYGVTPLPGAGEPFAVSGHRTTYGAPFFKLNELRVGDPIIVDTPYARFRYTVVKKTVVKPSDVSVLLDRGYGLVLTTCTPPYSASHRLVVWAALQSATLRAGGAAEVP